MILYMYIIYSSSDIQYNDSSNANGWYIYIYKLYMCVYIKVLIIVFLWIGSKTNYTRACVNPSSLYNIIHRWAATVVDGVWKLSDRDHTRNDNIIIPIIYPVTLKAYWHCAGGRGNEYTLGYSRDCIVGGGVRGVPNAYYLCTHSSSRNHAKHQRLWKINQSYTPRAMNIKKK